MSTSFLATKLIPVLSVAISGLLLVNLSHSLLDLYQSNKRISSQQQQKKQLETDISALKNNIGYLQSNEYLEEEGRNKLYLVKPGEMMVVLPENLSSEGGSQSLSRVSNKSFTNQQKWFDLFFPS